MSTLNVTCQCPKKCPSPNSRPCTKPITREDGLCDYCRAVHLMELRTGDKIFHCHTCGISIGLHLVNNLQRLFGG